MKNRRSVTVGTMESSDVLVTMTENPSGREIELDSVAAARFGEHIVKLINLVLDCEELDNVRVRVIDKGALDFAIRARLETASRRLKGGE